MTQECLLQPVPSHKLAQLSKEELIEFFQAQQRVIDSIVRDNDRLRAQAEELKQRVLLVDDQYIVLKNKLFGKSSEKEPKVTGEENAPEKAEKTKKKKVQLPSLRYPDAPLIERHVELQELPACSCCGTQMADSGMTEDSEFLTVIPKQFIVVRLMRHKYNCNQCHGEVKTAPAPKRVTPGSSLSDEMMIDVGLSKYCDLVPIERYAAIAGRGGLEDLPPQSLIESTHRLADFVDGAYKGIKQEILESKVLHADETPHRMLEGDEKTAWQLWGFSNRKASYFEIRDTRSGDIASEVLNHSQCEYLMSDVFSGYGKAVRQTNELRKAKGRRLVRNIYCNAHARRKFKAAKDRFLEEAQYFVDQYKEIYHLEDELKGKPPDEVMRLRSQMIPFFQSMRDRAMANLKAYSAKSSIAKAMNYFLGNYEEFTLFTKNPDLPIDNNPQERLLRNPVIGRKTWYGTHSKRGSLTAAILFSLVESCKLNQVNPRTYFKHLVQDLHQGKPAYTPYAFKNVNTG